MDNRKNHEVSTSFGEVMRTARIPTQQQYVSASKDGVGKLKKDGKSEVRGSVS